jgi:4'-phosphopantetheinyl transferase
MACRGDLVAPGDVHVWLIDLDAPPAGLGTILGPAERARASSYLAPRDAARFASGRGWLRVLLGRCTGAEPGRLQFDASAGGRLVLAGEHADRVHFSLSRSDERGLIAISGSPVGADIEQVRARAGLGDLITARFGAAEAGCIAAGCAGSPLSSFYRHWTAKEAYLKATGRGLAGLRATALTCGANPAIEVGGHAATWTVSLLDSVPDFAAAIVSAGRQ